jgi:polyphosphate kinase
MAASVSKTAAANFFNRELSWLEFNRRVLDEALNPATPLLERVKFLTIVSSNLDEFFEVRVAGLKQQVESHVVERTADGRTASQTLREIRQRVVAMLDLQYECWRKELLPGLARNGIRFLGIDQLDEADRDWIDAYYRKEVALVLTPLGIDLAHPFPQLMNKTLNILVQLELMTGEGGQKRLAIVQAPRSLPRLVKLPRDDGRMDYVFLANIIRHYLGDLFPGTLLLGAWNFRVTRNSELYIDEEDVANLLKAVEAELHNRRKGDAVRLEVEKDCPEGIRSQLMEHLQLGPEDLYVIDGPINPTRLMAIYDGDHSPELRDPPFIAPVASSVANEPDLFAAIRRRDILLHHPYESFSTVVDFLKRAAADPDVLAIKQTLYRTSGDMRIVGSLMEAVRNGKQVTAVVELKARFDEANNIRWARQLEEAGVHVVYGLVGYKVHSKMCLIVRRDEDCIRRYLHLGTGNYNPTTARFYTDVSLLTCRPDYGEDAANLFNLLTGICQFQGTKKLLVAPFSLHPRINELIDRETEHARRGLPARILAKMNALVDRETIEALYRASQAGVKIDLIVRGICCLRPGVPGLSETISVRSIVDRFLEHSRVAYFENALQPEVYVGSADWMPRNFYKRIEVVFPIEDGNLIDRLKNELLELQLADNTKARLLQPDGTYLLLKPGKKEVPRRSQTEFIELAVGKGNKAAPTAGKGAPTRMQVRRRPGS